mmetsp:Transcript_3753/g.9834  ORF Transcript_3753/g.9834 Transcript_3753/m.9834 type:complete len:130 (-) Transcript_3753:68-457(-)
MLVKSKLPQGQAGSLKNTIYMYTHVYICILCIIDLQSFTTLPEFSFYQGQTTLFKFGCRDTKLDGTTIEALSYFSSKVMAEFKYILQVARYETTGSNIPFSPSSNISSETQFTQYLLSLVWIKNLDTVF